MTCKSSQTVVVLVAYGGDAEESDSLCITLEDEFMIQEICKHRMYINNNSTWDNWVRALPLLEDRTPLEAAEEVLDEELGDEFDDLANKLKAVTSVSAARGYENANACRVIVCFVYN